jgi:hypothetical protein
MGFVRRKNRNTPLDQLLPGDLVKHIVNGEEGHILRPVLWCIGSNKGPGFLVDVVGKEKVWLEGETLFLERPIQKPSTE